MAKTGQAIMVFVGVMLILLAVFGISGFPISLSGTLIKEDWNSLALWKTDEFPGVCTIVSGELQMTPLTGKAGRSSCMRLNPPILPSQFTVEWKFRVPTGTTGYPYMLIQFYTGSNFVAIELMQDGARCEVSPTNYILRSFTPTDSQNHVWTMVIDQPSKNLKLYRDVTLVAEWTEMYSLVATPQIYYAMIATQANVASSYTDYFYVDTGLAPPGETPEEGYVTLYTKYSSDGGVTWNNAPNVQVTVQKGIVFYATWITDANGKYGPQSVTPGTYTFSASYSGLSDSETITIADGESKSVTLGFSSGFGPPEEGYITLYTKYSSDGGVTWNNAPNVQVTVQRNGVFYATWTTDSNGKNGPQTVTPATYTFSASYSTQSDSETITIADGESKSVTLGFSSGGGEPPDGQDWLQKIRDFLDDSMTRTMMLLCGVGLTGIGLILIVTGRKSPVSVPK